MNNELVASSTYYVVCTHDKQAYEGRRTVLTGFPYKQSYRLTYALAMRFNLAYSSSSDVFAIHIHSAYIRKGGRVFLRMCCLRG